jgi:APA family basic amino acid/polyamine antiporter
VPVVPALAALVAFALMASLPAATWWRLIIWMVIGIILYFFYGYSHSVLRHGPRRGAAASRR